MNNLALDWINIGDLWRAISPYFWGREGLFIEKDTFIVIAGVEPFIPARPSKNYSSRAIRVHIIATVKGKVHKGFAQFQGDGIKFRECFERVSQA